MTRVDDFNAGELEYHLVCKCHGSHVITLTRDGAKYAAERSRCELPHLQGRCTNDKARALIATGLVTSYEVGVLCV